MGVDDLKGVTTTPDSISTFGHTLVVSVENMALLEPTVKGGPVNIGVAELATTVGSVLGTPGELFTWAITARRQSSVHSSYLAYRPARS